MIHDWQIVQALPTLVGNTSYRIYIRSDRRDLHVEKRIGSGWRRNNSFTAGDISGTRARDRRKSYAIATARTLHTEPLRGSQPAKAGLGE